MVLLIVVVTVIVFILVDFSLRVYFQKRQEIKLRKEREEALDIGLKLDFSEEVVAAVRGEFFVGECADVAEGFAQRDVFEHQCDL